MPLAKDPSRAHLFRRQQPRGAWVFRVPKRVKSEFGSLVFSDERYGGDDAALKAAQEARDKLFTETQASILFKAQASITSNESKLPGVNFILKKSASPDRIAAVWEATWVEVKETGESRQVRKRFTCSVHGFLKSWELAVKQRQVGARITFTAEQIEAAAAVRDRLLRESIENGWV